MRESGEDRLASGTQRLRTWRLILGGAVWVLLCLILLAYNHYPGRLALQVGEKSPRDVRSFRTVKYIDPDETQRLKEEAAERQEPVYSRVPTALTDAKNDLHRAFDLLETSSQDLSAAALKEAFPEVSQSSLSWFLSADQDTRQSVREGAVGLLEKAMERPIRDISETLAQARKELREAASREFRSRSAVELVGGALSGAVRPNRRLDAEATASRRQEAMAEVKGVERPLQAGDIVVLKGERVTHHHLAMLRALGLTSPWAAGGWSKSASLVLLVLLGVAFLGISARQFAPTTYQNIGHLVLLGLVICVTIFAFNLFLLPLPNLSMFFLPASTLIIAVLLSPHLAFAAAVVQSLLVGLAAGGSLTLTLPTLGSCMVALAAANHIWPPSRLVRASAQLAIANFFLSAAAGVLADVSWGELARNAGMAFGYGACAPLLALGAIFLLQRPFDITSHVRLLELSNPKEPLLQRLQAEAPGTYYSSMIVANLAEAAAQSIGADSLLVRVGAVHHDIGKLRRPGLFVENQFLLGTENAHARLSPYLSALVILAHVRDGVELARRYGLPRVIQDIIEEHHGTTLVSYFYHQARSRQSGPAPQEGQYRYEGRRPRSKESAIIMLADAVQAAAKSLSHPNSEKMESLVEAIVNERQRDGQLQDSELTFRDLSMLKESFTRSLQGLHLHTRMEYPSFMRILGEDASANTELPEKTSERSRSQTRSPERHAG
ncbi:MAG: HDIG domain-containing protein [Armatimonadetes bacterium]|nr:HDIG domain-containing protein [Armatimonadota bacterium]NIM23402.1 HDIG domain-containing protein [Armatimonadota bacterium]NIM67267.1 HDIG domain-containing protein [Armatimonadota bacterium]NIM75765.1 HDIG domain-containing protein [Armatimonadota bacterium]NIN05453.1 HDIG domain-containing protein [Armatimonadota bacterium]